MMKTYSVTRVNGETIVTPDEKGCYRAGTSEEIKRALSEPNFRTTTAKVRIGNIWKPLGRKRRPGYVPRRKKRPFAKPGPIKPLSRPLRILKALHLYKDPLEGLIYKGK